MKPVAWGGALFDPTPDLLFQTVDGFLIPALLRQLLANLGAQLPNLSGMTGTGRAPEQVQSRGRALPPGGAAQLLL